MFIIRLYFLGTVSKDLHGGAMWRRRSGTYEFFLCSSGLCSSWFLVSASAFYELSWESFQVPELMVNDPCQVPVPPPCSFHSSMLLSPFPLPRSPPNPLPVGVYRLCGLSQEESKEEWDGGRKEEVASQLVFGPVNCFYCFMVGKFFGNVQHKSWAKSMKLFNNSTYKAHVSSTLRVRYAIAEWLTSINCRNANSLWIVNW